MASWAMFYINSFIINGEKKEKKKTIVKRQVSVCEITEFTLMKNETFMKKTWQRNW